MNLKNVRRGRIKEYTEKYPSAVYTAIDPAADCNPLWNYKATAPSRERDAERAQAQGCQNLIRTA